MKNKLLIIDDRWTDRSDIYRKVLSDEFEIEAVEKGSEVFKKIAKTKADAFLIDIVLSKWTHEGKPLELIDVLQKIQSKNPIILVSNQYGELLKNRKLTNLYNNLIEGGYNIASFLLWDDFNKIHDDNDTETINSRIMFEVLKDKNAKIKKEKKEFDFAVVCALSEELKPFMDNFKEIESQTLGKNIHVKKSILETKNGGKLKFLSVYTQNMGVCDASVVTSKLVSEFNIEYIFMIGVCGGRDGKVEIGDIIIPQESIAYQNGKVTNNGFTGNPDVAKSIGNIKGLIKGQTDKIIKNIFKEFTLKSIDKGETFGLSLPKTHYEPMACGASVVNKKGELDEIAKKTNNPKLCSVDMESYGIYRLSEILNIKVSVIKSVMDLSNDKTDKYKTYAAEMSANFLYQILYEELVTFNQNKNLI